jgi:DNA mismatch repair protein MutL
MPKILQLSSHVADLIAAGEVVERPASVAKELVENSIDAGAKNITVEIQNGGMLFLRVTDDGCGIDAADVETAFLRHATSKIRRETDLEAIHTLGFRGEALAATAAVSRIDLLTKTPEALSGVSLHLDAGQVTERSEAGCPDGTTIIVRDLFYNTPARMKFMKRDISEGAAVCAAVQKQAMAHPEIRFRFLRDGKEELSTPGDGALMSAVYAIFGRNDASSMVSVQSSWEKTSLRGFVSLPTATRGTRGYQQFYVNGRYVRNRLLSAALEEAYRNQIMAGRFPACVLHLSLPETMVDVNVHPAKTEVKFLSEREVFDCVHYGVLSALSKAGGRVELQFPRRKPEEAGAQPAMPVAAAKAPAVSAAPKETFFRTMRPEEFKAMAQVLKKPAQAPISAGQAEKLLAPLQTEVREAVRPPAPDSAFPCKSPEAADLPPEPSRLPPEPAKAPPDVPSGLSQEAIPLHVPEYRVVGEVLDTYFVVEQENSVIFIDKHAAHERILFEKLRAENHPVMGQLLLTPLVCRLREEETAAVLEHAALLGTLGYCAEDFGDGTVVLRQIPADLALSDAEASLSELAGQLLGGTQTDPAALRDALLHTIACKAAIKAGYHTQPEERDALVREVLSRDDLKYCPHGRPICLTLSQKQLEKQFRRA